MRRIEVTRSFWLALWFIGAVPGVHLTAQTLETMSIAQAQAVVDADLPTGITVTINTLLENPHADRVELRNVEAELGLDLIPDYVVRGDVLKDGRYVGVKRIQFRKGTVHFLDQWSPFDFRDAQPVEPNEKARLLGEIDALAKAALDVNGGTTRWSQFLPTSVRQFALVGRIDGDVTRYSEDALREVVAAWLDLTTVWQWWVLEQPRRGAQFLMELEAAIDSNGLEASQRVLRRDRPEITRYLRGLESSHLKNDTAFLTDVLFGAVYKVRNRDLKDFAVDTLRDSELIYLVQCGVGGVLLLQWSGEHVKIVDIALLEQ